MKAIPCSTPALILAVLCLSISAHETEEKLPYPGFRPESELAAAFVANLPSATVRILPTIIRTPTNTTFSTTSQQQVAALLDSRQITKTALDQREIDPGELTGQGQFDWFRNDMAAIGKEVVQRTINDDYVLVMEVLFPPDRGNRQSVFGVHCIVLDAKGQNAFSFLLNSHHQMFIDAGMVADDLSRESRDELVKKATALGMEAFLRQVQKATSPPADE